MSSDRLRCCIYTRVSLDPQNKGYSVSEQEAEGRAFVERIDGDVVAVLSDNGISASRYAKRSRPDYQKLRRLIGSDRIDMVVVWEASRLSRDLKDFADLRELSRRRHVRWSYQGKTIDLERTDDRFTAGLDALLAERESDMTRDRVLRSMKAGAMAGRPHGKRPYGYDRIYDNQSRALSEQIVNEGQAEVIREAADRVLTGEACYSIAQDFNRRGIPTAHKDGEWSLTQIRRLLINPMYIGMRVWRGEVVGVATWPPILDEATFYQCVARLKDPARRTQHDSAIKYFLSGIATCGVCGGHIRVGKPRGYPSYLCSAKFCVARKIEPVDDLVRDAIFDRFMQPDFAEMFVEDTPDAREALDAIAGLRGRLDGFYASAAAGEITPNALAHIESKLLAEIDQRESELRLLKLPTVAADLIHRPDLVWKAMSMPQKREVVRSLMTVTILPVGKGVRTFRPESVRIDWLRG